MSDYEIVYNIFRNWLNNQASNSDVDYLLFHWHSRFAPETPRVAFDAMGDAVIGEYPFNRWEFAKAVNDVMTDKHGEPRFFGKHTYDNDKDNK